MLTIQLHVKSECLCCLVIRPSIPTDVYSLPALNFLRSQHFIALNDVNFSSTVFMVSSHETLRDDGMHRKAFYGDVHHILLQKLFLKRRRAGHATLSSNHYLASQGVSFTSIFALKWAICISFHFRIINRLINAKLNHKEMRFARRLRVFWTCAKSTAIWALSSRLFLIWAQHHKSQIST